MIKIEKALKTSDSLRGVIYIKNESTGNYESEIGEVDIFNVHGTNYDLYVYLEYQYKDLIKVDKSIVSDKLNLDEKIKQFIWENYYEPAEISLNITISFLSDLPVISYEA